MASLSLGCVATPLAEGWHEVDTRNVRLRTNVSRDDALGIAAELQETRDALAGNVMRCGFEDPAPVEVTVLASEHYERVAPKKAGGYVLFPPAFGEGIYAPQIVLPDNLQFATRQIFPRSWRRAFRRRRPG
jgi:hypothetical protein